MSDLRNIRIKLDRAGFDGLYVSGECACLKEDLAPCGQCDADNAGWINGCKPGWRHKDPRPGRKEGWAISGSITPMTADDFEVIDG